MDKIAIGSDHISVRDFASLCFNKCIIQFLHEIFRFNVKLNVFLLLLLGFSILVSRKIFKIFRGNFAIFGLQLGWKCLWELRRSYYISIGGEKSKLWCFSSFFIFWRFRRENERGTMRAPNNILILLIVWASKPDQNVSPFGAWWTFWVNFYLEIACVWNFQGWTP